MLEILWISLGVLCLLAGFVGCFLPVLPGPPIAYLALIFLALAHGWSEVGVWTLVGLGVAAGVVTAIDMVIPVWGAKRYGASKAGIWLSVLGLIVGLVFFPPLGAIVGVFLGAFLGEVLAGKQDKEALRAAWGTFIGTLMGVGLKLACCGVITWFFVDVLW